MQSSPRETPLCVNSRAAYPAATPPPRITYTNALPILLSPSLSQPSPALLFLSNSLTICEISYGEALPLDTLPREKRTRFKYPIRYLVTHSMKRGVWPWHCRVDHNALPTPVILNVWYGPYHSQLKKTPSWSSGPTWNSTGLLSSDSLGPFWSWI